LRQQRLAAARRADQQDVRLRQLDIAVLGGVVQALVVVVDRHREHALGVILADDVIVEDALDLLRRRHALLRLHQRGFVLLTDDVHAEFDAFIADEHGRPGDELTHLVLALPAERAIESVLGLSAGRGFAHTRSFKGPTGTTELKGENGGLMTPDSAPHNRWLTTIPFKNVAPPGHLAGQFDHSKVGAASGACRRYGRRNA
jgi:hypothetical protein